MNAAVKVTLIKVQLFFKSQGGQIVDVDVICSGHPGLCTSNGGALDLHLKQVSGTPPMTSDATMGEPCTALRVRLAYQCCRGSCEFALSSWTQDGVNPSLAWYRANGA